MDRNIRVAIVDDDPLDRELIMRTLQSVGPNITTLEAASPEQFERVIDQNPDVILADFDMPFLGAPEVLSRLKRLNIDIPVIVVSGAINDETAISCVRAGACDYVLKDRMGRLPEAVSRAINEHELRIREQQVQEALRENEARYRRMFERSPVGTFIADGTGKIEACNPAFVEIFGFDRSDAAVGYCVGRILFESGELFSGFLRDLGKGGSVKALAHEMTSLSGSTIFGDLSIAGITGADGQIQRIEGFVFDKTQEMNLDMQARHAQRLQELGNLTGSIVHDFNNILTVVLTPVELLLRRGSLDAKAVKELEQVLKATEKAAALTGQLLTFSKKRLYRPTVVDPVQILDGLKEMLHRLLGHSVRLDISHDQSPWKIKIDPTHFEQVIVNLVVNARDAMPAGGNLELGFTSGENSLYISVRDSGSGISPDLIDTIFDPFFTTKDTGTGLGLATVYGIVDRAGGEITVESEQGVGTTFTIRLPLVTEELDSNEVKTIVTSDSLNGDETIFLWEPDEMVRHVISDALASFGYRVVEPSPGVDLIPQLDSLIPQVDLMIADVQAITSAGIGQSLAGVENIPPLILTSGYLDENTDLSEIPHRAIIEKPFSINELAETVRACVTPSEALR